MLCMRTNGCVCAVLRNEHLDLGGSFAHMRPHILAWDPPVNCIDGCTRKMIPSLLRGTEFVFACVRVCVWVRIERTIDFNFNKIY